MYSLTKRVGLLLLSSFLIFLSYPKFSFSTLAFISLIPYILVVFDIKTKKEAIKYGFLYGFFTYLFILYWIYPTLRSAGANFLTSILSLFLLSAILSFEFVIITFISYLSKTTTINMAIFVIPSIWTFVDFLKVNITRYIPYFPWFEIGYSQWNMPYILNLAHSGGVYTITFLIVLINSILASIIMIDNWKGKIKRFIVVVIIMSLAINYARIKYNDTRRIINSSDRKIKIGFIQPSIDFYKKWNVIYADEIKSRIEKLITSLSPSKADIIIWPENALYGWIDDPDVFSWLCKNIKNSATYHIVGSVSKRDQKYVSAYLINKDCKIIYEYNKRMLVPFGEYVPFRSIIGNFTGIISSLGEFEKGKSNQRPFEFENNIKIAQTICYETAFDYLFYPDDDVDLFVNITNDGWYLNTSAPYQHFAIGVLRAVENERPLIRSANNGISAVIYPDGSISSKLNLNEYGYRIEEVKIINTSRNNDLTRNLAVYISFLILFAFILAILIR